MKDTVASAVADAVARDQDGRAVECHETHGSWVFVAGDRALKVKKPVVLPFLDDGTLERRRAMCREEVRVNRRLAPALYRGTVSVVARGSELFVDPDDEASGAVEVAVDMRRYDERDTLAERLRIGAATPAQLRAVGALLAGFHAAEPGPHDAARAFAALRAAVRTTLDDLRGDGAPGEMGDGRLWQLRGGMEAALAARRTELLERGRRGLVVDGHGDLRAEHVLLTEPIQIVDAVEFDPGLRIADVSCDLGFLVMDLEGAGGDVPATALVEGYREAGGDAGDRALLASMARYRALVRARSTGCPVATAASGPRSGCSRPSNSDGGRAARSSSPYAERRPVARARWRGSSAPRAAWTTSRPTWCARRWPAWRRTSGRRPRRTGARRLSARIASSAGMRQRL
jgi:aminoglycoside phosphotransferase family enzyme